MPENILTETGVLSRVLGMVGQPGGIAGLDNDGHIIGVPTAVECECKYCNSMGNSWYSLIDPEILTSFKTGDTIQIKNQNQQQFTSGILLYTYTNPSGLFYMFLRSDFEDNPTQYFTIRYDGIIHFVSFPIARLLNDISPNGFAPLDETGMIPLEYIHQLDPSIWDMDAFSYNKFNNSYTTLYNADTLIHITSKHANIGDIINFVFTDNDIPATAGIITNYIDHNPGNNSISYEGIIHYNTRPTLFRVNCTSSGQQGTLFLYEPIINTDKGIANGVAGLNSDAKIDSSYLRNEYICTLDGESVAGDNMQTWEDYGYISYTSCIIDPIKNIDYNLEKLKEGDIFICQSNEYDEMRFTIIQTNNPHNGDQGWSFMGIGGGQYSELMMLVVEYVNPGSTFTVIIQPLETVPRIQDTLISHYIPKNETGYLDASYFNHIDVHVKGDFKIYTDSSYQTLNSYQEIDVPSDHNLFSNITPGCILDISTNKFNKTISSVVTTKTHISGVSNVAYAYGYCYIAPGNIMPGTKDISAGPYVTTIYNGSVGSQIDEIHFEPLLTFSNFWNLKGPEISEHCVLRDEPQPIEFVTQAEYDASTAKRSNTLYVITDASF